MKMVYIEVPGFNSVIDIDSIRRIWTPADNNKGEALIRLEYFHDGAVDIPFKNPQVRAAFYQKIIDSIPNLIKIIQ